MNSGETGGPFHRHCRHTTTHCNTPQRTATHRNSLLTSKRKTQEKQEALPTVTIAPASTVQTNTPVTVQAVYRSVCVCQSHEHMVM